MTQYPQSLFEVDQAFIADLQQFLSSPHDCEALSYDVTVAPGFLCEVCLDATAASFVGAPWGGEMGICAACWAPASPESSAPALPEEE